MVALNELSAYAHPGKDESGLGRAVWILFDYNGHKFRIVTAYRPCANKKKRTKSGRLSKSVWRLKQSEGGSPRRRELQTTTCGNKMWQQLVGY